MDSSMVKAQVLFGDWRFTLAEGVGVICVLTADRAWDHVRDLTMCSNVDEVDLDDCDISKDAFDD